MRLLLLHLVRRGGGRAEGEGRREGERVVVMNMGEQSKRWESGGGAGGRSRRRSRRGEEQEGGAGGGGAGGRREGKNMRTPMELWWARNSTYCWCDDS